jgi:hypothetical protein
VPAPGASKVLKVGSLLGPIPVIGCCAGVSTEKSKQKQTTAVLISFVGQDNTNGIAFVISVLLKLMTSSS